MNHAILFVIYLDEFSKSTWIIVVYSLCIAECLKLIRIQYKQSWNDERSSVM